MEKNENKDLAAEVKEEEIEKLKDSEEPEILDAQEKLEDIADIDVVEKESKEIVEDVKNKKSRSKKFWVITSIIGGLALLTIVSLIFILVYKADSAIWPSSLYGNINDVTNNPVSGVSVCVQGKCVDTDNSGFYSIGKLIYGDYEVTVNKSGYVRQNSTIKLIKGTDVNLTFQLEQIKVGTIVVPVKFEYNAGHQYYNDGFSLKIDDGANDYSVFPETCLDPQFNIYITCKVTFYNVPIGPHKLELVSTYFATSTSDFEAKHGSTTLSEVLLSPVMIISGSVTDGFFGGPLEKAKVKFTAPFQLEVETDATGNYSVKDIKIPQSSYPKLKVVYEVSKEGYVTGKSESEFSMDYNYPTYDTLLPTGRVVTVSNKLGNKNLISTGIDGSGEFTISDNKGDNYNPVLLKDGKTIRFLSTRDVVKSQYGSTIPMVYQIDIDGKNLVKISKTVYFDNDGIGYFNLVSGKRAYAAYEWDGAIGSYSLKVGNIEGTELKTVETKKGDGYYGAMVIADSGDFMLYTWKDNVDQTKSGVYRYDFKTDKIDYIYNIKDTNYIDVKALSKDLNKALVLITSNWDDGGDLWLLSIKEKTMTKITSSTTGEQKPTFFNDDKSILYLSRRDDLLSVYIWDLAKGKETKINNVSGTDQEFYANMCADLVASTMYSPTKTLIDKALGQENAMCPGPYYRYYD